MGNAVTAAEDAEAAAATMVVNRVMNIFITLLPMVEYCFPATGR
jgi:hypothetical protein